MSDKRETEVKENLEKNEHVSKKSKKGEKDKKIEENNKSKEKQELRDGTKYRKVENKKHRTGITLKRFIILVFVLVLILGLIIGVRWRILYNIQENYMKASLKDNWHYFSDSETTLMNVYRKDSIWKMNVRQKNGEGNLTFWADMKTGEKYIFWEEPIKRYSIDQGGLITNLPTASLYTTEENTRVMLATMPMWWIGTDKYDGKDCYVIKSLHLDEYIDKETGLLLATFEDNKQTTSVEYEFYKVTDEDVAKPDLSQYEYVE